MNKKYIKLLFVCVIVCAGSALHAAAPRKGRDLQNPKYPFLLIAPRGERSLDKIERLMQNHAQALGAYAQADYELERVKKMGNTQQIEQATKFAQEMQNLSQQQANALKMVLQGNA